MRLEPENKLKLGGVVVVSRKMSNICAILLGAFLWYIMTLLALLIVLSRYKMQPSDKLSNEQSRQGSLRVIFTKWRSKSSYWARLVKQVLILIGVFNFSFTIYRYCLIYFCHKKCLLHLIGSPLADNFQNGSAWRRTTASCRHRRGALQLQRERGHSRFLLQQDCNSARHSSHPLRRHYPFLRDPNRTE